MDSRKGAKEAVLFAKKQWREAKPKTVEARRVKDENAMVFGFPPFAIKTKAPVKFVVCAEYSDTLTIFQFSNKGQLLGSKIFAQSSKIKKEIVRKSNLIVRFPRKPPS